MTSSLPLSRIAAGTSGRIGVARAVIVRMQLHEPTIAYASRRTADGRTTREIIRCLKGFLAHEIYQRNMTDFRTRHDITNVA